VFYCELFYIVIVYRNVISSWLSQVALPDSKNVPFCVYMLLYINQSIKRWSALSHWNVFSANLSTLSFHFVIVLFLFICVKIFWTLQQLVSSFIYLNVSNILQSACLIWFTCVLLVSFCFDDCSDCFSISIFILNDIRFWYFSDTNWLHHMMTVTSLLWNDSAWKSERGWCVGL